MDNSFVIMGLALYAVGQMFFLTETYLEGERCGGSWDLYRVCGLMSSLVWPMHLLAIGVTAMWCARHRIRHAALV
ncbi:MAG: hypothetical protein O9256_04265 [Rhizobiaceae bacterium]|nr:hypothetical protein [Rhizobiaceae bacterium]MCZ8351869.1 hypothetical protein [Rhizobium sp.]